MPGKILGIMGPSGSGKTTLLNSLAGQLVSSKGLRLEGNMAVNGVEVTDGAAGIRKAYVRQEDIFYSQMTVRETLLFAARLRLPRTMPLASKEALVEEILGKLSLTKCANTIVGSNRVRGISGGEKKRLSIGCELIASPSLIFLDEPTTGLDSFQAEKVVASLKTLALEGHTVVCVIHQPSGSVYNMLDDLLLLSEGLLLYQGPANCIAGHLARLGHRAEANIHAGEQCLKVASVNFESPETEAQSRARIQELAARFQERCPDAAAWRPAEHIIGGGGGGGLVRKDRAQAGFFEQFRLLLSRSWREVWRNKGANLIKAVQQVGTALIYGSIYTLTDTQSSIQDRLGLLSLVTIGTANVGLAGTIRAFPKEKDIVVADRSKRIYGALPYFLAKMLAEAPVNAILSVIFGSILYPMVGFQRTWPKFFNFVGINALHSFASSAVGLMLGAMAPSSDAALALLPPVIVLSIIFNGLNIAEEDTPKLLRWAPQVSMIRWGFEGLCLNEFRGLRFTCDRPVKQMCANTGEEALARLSACFEHSSLGKTTRAQAAILGACYLQTLRVLSSNGPRYARMETPRAAPA